MKKEIIKDNSHGIIPVYKDPKMGFLFLVINQHYEYWGLPKGHREGNETPVQTAIRELEEEVGITDCEIISKKEFIQKYQFEKDGKIVARINTFHIGFVDNMQVATDNREVVEAKWLQFNEAIKTLKQRTHGR